MIEIIAAFVIGAGFIYCGLVRYFKNKDKDKDKKQ